MTSTFFDTTPVGRGLNWLSNGKLFPAPDQRPGWQLPDELHEQVYGKRASAGSSSVHGQAEASADSDAESIRPPSRRVDSGSPASSTRHSSDVEKSNDAPIIVGWYGPDDPENPLNWPFSRKAIATAAIYLYTFCVYGGTSIITPSTEGVMAEFNVSETKAILSLSVFMLGLGVGPLLLSPISNMPSVGRSHPYWMSVFVMTLLNIGAADAKSYGTLITMRLLGGIAGAPPLATGGATMGDMFEKLALPKAIAVWASGAVAGPVFGPVIAGFAAQNVSWRLPYWIFVAMSGLGLIMCLCVLPETLADNILYRRAQRLRALTGDQRLRSQGEIKQAQTSTAAFIKTAFWTPIRITFDPIVLYSSVLLGLVYAILYAAFEATPIIFMENHGFNLGESELPYLGLGVNAYCVTLPLYLLYLHYYFDPRFLAKMKRGRFDPEDRLLIALIAAPLVPICLFWIGWTGSGNVSYWSPLLGFSLYITPVFLFFQAVLVYLAIAYKDDQASVLASNALVRFFIAAAFPIFATPMFRNLGLGKAYSTLGGISCALLLPLVGLYVYGGRIRRASRFAHDYEKDFQQPQEKQQTHEEA